MSEHRAYEQFATLALVGAGHLLLVMAFLFLTERKEPGVIAEQRHAILFLVEPEPVVSEPSEPALPDENREQSRVMTPADVENARSSNAITVPPPAPPESEAPHPRANVDWYGEGERSARITAEKLGHQPAPSDDKPRPFEWNPEPKTVGFDGLLPYVRIGKRCVVGLGFFGCAIGKLPEANGDLFEGMHDPDRPRSSVPDSH